MLLGELKIHLGSEANGVQTDVYSCSYIVIMLLLFCLQVIYVNRFSSSSRKNAVNEIKVLGLCAFSMYRQIRISYDSVLFAVSTNIRIHCMFYP